MKENREAKGKGRGLGTKRKAKREGGRRDEGRKRGGQKEKTEDRDQWTHTFSRALLECSGSRHDHNEYLW